MKLFQQTLEKSIVSMIKSSSSKAHLQQLHSFLITTSLIHNRDIFICLLTRFSLPPFRYLTYSTQLLRFFPNPSYLLYTALIRAHLLRKEDSGAGFRLFREIFRLGISSNSECAFLGIKCCSKMGSLVSGQQIHGVIVKDGCDSEIQLITSLMQFYSSVKMVNDATKVFSQMPKIDAFTCNVLIQSYVDNKRGLDALNVFDLMVRTKGCEPTNVTCVLILKCCAKLEALEFGEKVHNYAKEHGFCDDLNVCNAVITMYLKCGNVNKAKEVFDGMVRRDVVTWTAMISGLARRGCEMDAIDAFRQMEREGFTPDEHAFTAVLSACSKIGILDECKLFFDMMTKKYTIKPNIYHYGCLVDLMSRSGLIQEAYVLIMSMKVKPDILLWRTLLGACNKHNNDVISQLVVRQIAELKAQKSGDHVLLLNMHLLAGNVEKAEEVKELIERQTKFTPGCSTIQFKGKVHVFNADDTTHPQKDQILSKLTEINKQLKIAGYVVKAMPEFQSKITEVKYESPSYHSEKMAIAFGILSTPPGTNLKIAKLLLVCDDCHNFAKMVSTVYDREVIITDSAHCHNFYEGSCSCDKDDSG